MCWQFPYQSMPRRAYSDKRGEGEGLGRGLITPNDKRCSPRRASKDRTTIPQGGMLHPWVSSRSKTWPPNALGDWARRPNAPLNQRKKIAIILPLHRGNSEGWWRFLITISMRMKIHVLVWLGLRSMTLSIRCHIRIGYDNNTPALVSIRVSGE